MINKFDNEYIFLSNYYTQNITYKGITYNCAMNAYYGQLISDNLQKKAIANATPSRALSMVINSISKIDYSQEEQDNIMYEILKVKFSDSKLKNLLLQTNQEPLNNNINWEDTYWGICNDEGDNKLGKLLMKLRDELSNDTFSNDTSLKNNDEIEDYEEDLSDEENDNESIDTQSLDTQSLDTQSLDTQSLDTSLQNKKKKKKK